MVAQLRLALLALLVLGLLGCQGGEDVSSNKDMTTPSAPNGPKVDDWAAKNPNNGAPGHGEDK